MKKQVKGLIALGTVTAVLGGGLAILKLTDKSDDDTSSSSSVVQDTEAEGANLVLIEDSDEAPGSHTAEQEHTHGVVDSVKVKNSTGGFETSIIAAATETDLAKYTLKGYEDIPLDDTSVGYLSRAIDNLPSASLIEKNCSDLGKFGLAEPEVTVEVNYQSGRKRTLYVGDVSPVSKQNYVKVDDSNDVYTVTSARLSNYYKKPEELLSLTLLEKPSDDDFPKIKSVNIKRGDLDEDIRIEYDPMSEVTNSGGTSATHVLAKPIATYLSPEKSVEITTGIFGLKGDSVKYALFTDKDKEEAGLNDPYCTVEVKCEGGKKYELYLSKPFTDKDGIEKVYGLLEGSKVIYSITTGNAKWINITTDELVSRTMFASYVWNISELTAKTGDITENFTISMKNSSMATNSAKTADVNVRRNGEAFDAERFRLFNAFLIEFHAENLALDEEIPKDKLMATVVVKDSLRNTEMTYEFYEYSVMKSLVVINGESRYFCSMKNTESLVSNIKKIGTGETFNDIS